MPDTQSSPPKKKRRILKWFVIVFFLCIGILVRGCLPGGTGIIARTTAPDGTEMCVVQKYDQFFEPYEIGFYYRKPGKPWVGFTMITKRCDGILLKLNSLLTENAPAFAVIFVKWLVSIFPLKVSPCFVGIAHYALRRNGCPKNGSLKMS